MSGGEPGVTKINEKTVTYFVNGPLYNLVPMSSLTIGFAARQGRLWGNRIVRSDFGYPVGYAHAPALFR